MPASASPSSFHPSVAGRSLVIATRESRLALWQAEHVQAKLNALWGVPVSLLGMTTQGDRVLDRALSKIGGKGLFVKELEAALAERRADLAVHSLKDVPMHMPEGFELAAVLPREDPSDALVSHRHASLAALPRGARVGTSSLRRVVQLKALRPDLEVTSLRGNLDTRLRKLDDGDYDAIVLAAAGLIRLGLASRIRERLSSDQMLPAVGQGALAIEIRHDDVSVRHALRPLVHNPTWLVAHAERAVSRRLGGSCSMPLAAHAVFEGDRVAQGDQALQGHPGRMHLRALIGNATETHRPLLRAQASASVASVQDAEALGTHVAETLLSHPDARTYLAL